MRYVEKTVTLKVKSKLLTNYQKKHNILQEAPADNDRITQQY